MMQHDPHSEFLVASFDIGRWRTKWAPITILISSKCCVYSPQRSTFSALWSQHRELTARFSILLAFRFRACPAGDKIREWNIEINRLRAFLHVPEHSQQEETSINEIVAREGTQTNEKNHINCSIIFAVWASSECRKEHGGASEAGEEKYRTD